MEVQFVTLGMMFLGGLALGVLYDLYRVLSDRLNVPNWVLAILDIVYWLVGTVLVFRLLYASNHGQVRIFIFIGLVIGILFYFSFLSRMTIRFICFMIKVVQAAIRIGKRTIDIFIVTPILFLYRCVIILFGFLMALAIFLYKFVLQLLYPFWRLFAWLAKPLIRWVKSWRWLQAVIRTLGAWWRRWFGPKEPG
nr:spore cortex biosynthesis protein YabQ [Paenibacillus hamazuiensis]